MAVTTVVKGVKLRLYPNQVQINQLWQLFGNRRGWLKRVIKPKSPTSARTTCIN
ncbi:hypothetical protein EFP95_14410 [Lentilactobacillus hilgardii]|nr:hypothetical protein [Lentilactobacillus hilgardii]